MFCKKTITIVCVLTLLCGCTTHKRESQKIEKDSLLNIENQVGVFSTFSQPIPAGKNDMIFQFRNSLIYYLDPTTQTKPSIFCTKPGCQHTDEDCPAYLKDAEYLLAYKGLWYYYTDTTKSEKSLIVHDPVTNTRKVIMKIQDSKDENIINFNYFNTFTISYDHMYIFIFNIKMNILPGENSSESNITTTLVDIDLHTLKSREIISYDNSENSLLVIGGNGNELIINYREFSNNMTIDQSELRKYNLDTLEYEVIVPKEKKLCNYSDNHCIMNAHHDVIYYTDHEIYIYNIDSGENRLVYHFDDEIVFTRLLGNSIYFLKNSKENKFEFYLGNVNGDEPVKLKNNGQTDVAAMTLSYTTENGYIGLFSHGDSGYGWISAEDFKNDHFENKVLLPRY